MKRNLVEQFLDFGINKGLRHSLFLPKMGWGGIYD